MSGALEIIGVVAIALIGLVVIVIAGSAIFLAVERRAKKIFAPRLTLSLIGLLYQPARALLKRLGRSPRKIELAGIDLLNLYSRRAFRAVAPKDRLLLLPHCLRHLECPAKTTFSEGIKCVMCGKCGIAQVERACRERGMHCYIAMGSQFAYRILRERNPGAVLGVACANDLFRTMYEVNRAGLPMAGILLSRDGCIMTDVDWAEITDTIFETGLET